MCHTKEKTSWSVPRHFDSEDDYELLVSGTVDTSVEGTYVITYYYTFEGSTITARRTVNVEDSFPVVFYLIGEETITIELGQGYTDPGLYISDISIPVTVDDEGVDITKLGVYTINFSITVEGQTRTLTRTLEVVEPLFVLLGDETITLSVGDTWVDPGFQMNDTSITVQVDDQVDTSAAGTYTVTYFYIDGDNQVTIVRTVIVQ